MQADLTRPTTAFARYSTVAMALHWLIALGIAVNLLLGWNFRGVTAATRHVIVPLHESIGLTILMLTIARIAWRLANPPPPLGARLALWERALAHTVHTALYIFMLMMPLAGWLIASTWTPPKPLAWWGVPFPYVPFLPSGDLHPIGNMSASVHEWLAYLFCILFAFHLAGALKHQFWDGDRELARMIPFTAAASPRLE